MMPQRRLELLPSPREIGPLRAALAPHWGALLALALFLVVGLAVLDDYGVSHDAGRQRGIAVANARYATGDRDALYGLTKADHLYGVAFEAPLLLVERAFRLGDSRSVHLTRHLLTHLFFLVGGLFAYLLARRLFGARALGLFAMALFLLHPRLYAHSFFNSKDIPFLVAFVIALYLAHRAFRKDTLWTFVLLGVGVGIAVNLRIMGVVLLAAIPALRALDIALAPSWRERKRVILATGAFALASLLTVYALLPYLWSDPLARAVEWWTTLSDHPEVVPELFRGVIYPSAEFPAEYLPVWFSITAPLFALALGLAGAAAVVVNGAASRRRALRNTRLRFWALALGCFASPSLAVVLLDANIYNGWRQVYFLWAPFSLLAAHGLGWLGLSLRRARLRAAVYGAVGAGLAATVISMALLHPNEQVYFNAFADRTTPERLGTQYVMDGLGHPMRQALEWLLEEHPFSDLNANAPNSFGEHLIKENTRILPDASRARLSWIPNLDAFMIRRDVGERPDLELRRLKVYGNTILTIERKDDLRAVYAASKASEPIIRADFNVYHVAGALVFVREPCGEDDAADSRFLLRVAPDRAPDLPAMWARYGYEDRSFRFSGHGATFDGKCVASVPLPSYSVAAVRIRQWLPIGITTSHQLLWDSTVVLNPDAWRARWRSAVSGEPLARAAFDLYLDGGALVYAKQPCGPEDTATRFFLHVAPERAGDLPRERRGHGFENLGFEFFLRGGHFDGKCLARVALPDYPIASARTGQYVSGVGEVWSVEFALGEPSPPALLPEGEG